MSAAPVLASIGDHGVLNSSLPAQLSDIWLDRDLSWLDFNERVLAEALDDRTPLLERAKSGSYVVPPVRRVHIPKGDGVTD